MKKILLILLVLVICVSCNKVDKENNNQFAEKQINEDIPKSGKKPPDFTVKTNYNNEFTFYKNNGKPTLINFFATWCGPCVEEMPAFEKIKEEYGDQINLIIIDCGEEKNVVDKFIKDNNYTFTVGYDEGDISNLYNVTGIPFTVITNKKNEIMKTFTGSRGMEAQYNVYKEQIEKALNED